MKKAFLSLLLLISFSSCKSSKSVSSRSKNSKSLTTKVRKIVTTAESFKGVRYKYGGTTKKGMDCSGLIYTAFKQENVALPRTSKAMSQDGKWIDLKKAKEGDLLFFATKKNSRKINHVGLVVNTNPMRFIHSTTSKGVIVSSLKERYWYLAFVQARRIL